MNGNAASIKSMMPVMEHIVASGSACVPGAGSAMLSIPARREMPMVVETAPAPIVSRAPSVADEHANKLADAMALLGVLVDAIENGGKDAIRYLDAAHAMLDGVPLPRQPFGRLFTHPDGRGRPEIFDCATGRVSRCVSSVASENVPDAWWACEVLNRFGHLVRHPGDPVMESVS